MNKIQLSVKTIHEKQHWVRLNQTLSVNHSHQQKNIYLTNIMVTL